MMFNTAAGFVLAGIGLTCSGRLPKLKLVTSAALFILGATTLVQYATGLDLGIDQALFRSWLAASKDPGRMGVNTAACFTTVGLIWGVSRLFPRKSPLIALTGSVGVISVAIASIIGYLSGMESVYRWGQATTSMAANSTVGFLVLGLGIGTCGWRALRFHDREWLSAAVGASVACITLLIWAGAVSDHRKGMLTRSQTVAASAARLTTGSLTETLAALTRFAERWAPECRGMPASCDRDLANYFRDFPALTSLEWVERATGAIVGRRVSPGLIGRDPLEIWRPSTGRLPYSELIHPAVDSPRLVLALGRPGSPYFLAASLDPSVVLLSATSALGAEWMLRVTVDSEDVLAGQEPLQAILSAETSVTWLYGNWTFTVAPAPGRSSASHIANWILLAGMSGACFAALLAFLWQVVRERMREIESLNAELETKVADRTGDLVGMNETLRAAIEEERRVGSLLRDRESQLETAFRAGKIGSWSCDLVSGEVVWNGKLKELYGLPPDETPGTIDDFMRMVHPDDREVIHLALADAIAGRKEYSSEFRVIWPDDTVRWLAAQGSITRNEDGGPLRLEGINLDITGRKEAELALHQSEKQILHLADALPQFVWTATPDGNRDYYNQRWYDYTGRTFKQIQDSGWQPVLHPDDVENCIQRWTKAVTSGEPYEIEYRFKRASDGSYRWHLGRAVPIRGATGEIVRWFGTGTDIEDYKQAEAAVKGLNETLEERVRQRTAELADANQELAHTQSKLQSILDAATQVSIIATDTQGTIEVFNAGAERMLLYRADEMVARRTPEILHDPAECRRRSEELSLEFGRLVEGFDVFTEHARHRRFDERPWTYIRKDGSALDVTLIVTAVRSPDGAIEGFLGIATDITARKTLERELRLNNDRLAEQTRRAEEASRAKSDFLATMSHEIRTPMNAILGMAELLWESDLNAEQQHYVDVFRRAGSNLLSLINDILDLSKIEAGHFELEQVGFNIEEVVDQAVELASAKAREKGILLMSRISPGIGTAVAGDPTRLRQVLINLLGNAVKFTDTGEIVLTVRNHVSGDPRRIEFSISDTGIGIPAEKVDSIFDNFTQADSSTTRQYGGSGLGLSISRRIVELMGGALTVTSTVGQGSIFTFAPLFDLAPPKSVSLPAGEVQDFEGRRVLVLDDNATNRLIVCEALGAWGLETRESAAPAACLSEISESIRDERPYSLVIVDKCMPGMDGFTVASRIREISPDLPVIMLTSDSRPEDLVRRQELSLAGYALKPVKRTELFRLVSCALNGQLSAGAAPIPDSRRFNIAPLREQKPLRILVAEDSPNNRLVVQAFLKNSPHAVTFAEDGQKAVDEFAAARFDLILMDVQMPVMDGLTATAMIRARERELGLPATPIVALTANARSGDIAKSLAAGCDGHLTKPITKQRLLAAIEEHGQLYCEWAGPPPGAIDPIVIDVPEDLEDLLPEYLAERKQDLPDMLHLLAVSDFERLRILAHNLKGSGGTYGFPGLSQIGATLEQSATVADIQLLRDGLSQLESYLNRIQLVSVSR